jgi:hypothetical protein
MEAQRAVITACSMLQIKRPQKPTIFSDLAIWWPVMLEALLFASHKGSLDHFGNP